MMRSKNHPETRRKEQGQGDPHARPDRRFGRPDRMNPAVKDAKVDGQHRKDEADEPDPEPNVRRDHVRLIRAGVGVSARATSATVRGRPLFKISLPGSVAR